MLNLVVAYALWALGPFSPHLHLLVVGRDDQWAVWCATGGGFVLGWLRDAVRLPTYVALARGDNAEFELHNVRTKHTPTPALFFQPTRILLSWALSGILGWLFSSVVDVGDHSGNAASLVYGALRAAGVAAAVYLVGNIGWHAGTFRSALRGAIVGVAASLVGLESPFFNIGFLASFGAFSHTRRWKTPEEYAAHVDGGALAWADCGLSCLINGGESSQIAVSRGLGARLKRVCLVTLLAAALVGSGLYHHGAISNKDGETVRFKDCVNHILNSPAWKEFSFFEAYERYSHADSYSSGWDRFFEFVKDSSDFQGEKGARQVLGVSKDASWKEVKSAHRVLALKLHPDRCSDADCEERFTEMQAAYDLLKALEDKRKMRRARKEAASHRVEGEEEGESEVSKEVSAAMTRAAQIEEEDDKQAERARQEARKSHMKAKRRKNKKKTKYRPDL